MNKGDVTLVYSAVKNGPITLKRGKKGREENKDTRNDRNGGYSVYYVSVRVYRTLPILLLLFGF